MSVSGLNDIVKWQVGFLMICKGKTTLTQNTNTNANMLSFLTSAMKNIAMMPTLWHDKSIFSSIYLQTLTCSGSQVGAAYPSSLRVRGQPFTPTLKPFPRFKLLISAPPACDWCLKLDIRWLDIRRFTGKYCKNTTTKGLYKGKKKVLFAFTTFLLVGTTIHCGIHILVCHRVLCWCG